VPSTILTPEQDRAVAIRDVSVALSAGAGCGKTHVLTERYLSHLDPSVLNGQPAALDQLVAITFTDAAAREMRDRIRRTCYQRLQDSPTLGEQNEWLRLLRAIDTARVSTIHSFCTSLLRAHPAEAGLDPMFGVLDQSDADVILSQVIDDVLRNRLTDRNVDTLALADAFGLMRVKQQLTVLMRHRHAASFRTWLNATPDEVVTAWKGYYGQDAFKAPIGEIASTAPIDEMLSLLAAAETTKLPFREARANLIELLPKLKEGKLGQKELACICQFARVHSICTARDWASKDDYERYRDCCKATREAVESCQLSPWNDHAASQAAELGLALLRLAHGTAEVYQARKDALGRLDFDDLLAYTHRVLTSPEFVELRNRLAARLQLVLVDEFQDTDQLQVDLVTALCGPAFSEGRLFFVGDFKQSIYRFRGAEPEVFRALQAKVPPLGQLELSFNFRSQPAILDFVNALFHKAIKGYEPLGSSRQQKSSPPNVEFLWKLAPNKNSYQKGAAQEARRLEAGAIARRLRGLLDAQSSDTPIVDRDTGKPRQLRPGDVAILFRALSDVQLYEEALREYGLDYYLVGGHAFYAQQEIYDVLNLLRAVASTADEVSLAGALRSPFFALADETLFWLVDQRGSLNAGLLAEVTPAQLSGDERAKVTAAAATIRHLRAIKDFVPVAQLLNEALARTGYDAVLVAEFLGERKLANLHKLLEQARAVDQGVLDLAGFITQLDQFVARQPQEPLAATCPETANVIRLMTIHHAKGLEFPFVIVPDLDRAPHSPAPVAALDPELGPLVPLPTDDETDAAVGMDMYYADEKCAEREERVRLLYVAATRAADYLILSSSLESFDRPRSDWMQLLTKNFQLESGRFLSVLPADQELPKIRVTTEPQADYEPVGSLRSPDLLHIVEDARRLASEKGGTVPSGISPIPVDRAARQYFSFSRLSGQFVRSDLPRAFQSDRTPEAADIHAVDARGIGSLVHAVLERMNLADEPAVIARWCEHMAPEHVTSNFERSAADAQQLIQRLATSPRARQLAAATALHREVEFLFAWRPHGYLHGFIDCLYQDRQEGWHLIDYKTNDVSKAQIAQVALNYELQMYVYAMATEKVLGIPPVELAVHFLRLGIEHTFAWNDAVRSRAIDLINKAIAECNNPLATES
jgi:ATP-dependent helicase/nuclease subunit A